jgi:hypothetical protein
LRGKINELETNNKNKNIRGLFRGINEFEKGYQPRSNITEHENSDLLADYYILRYTDLFVLYEIRRNCHSSGRNLLLYQFIKRVMKTDCNDYHGIFLLSTTYKILTNILLARLTPCVNEVIGYYLL